MEHRPRVVVRLELTTQRKSNCGMQISPLITSDRFDEIRSCDYLPAKSLSYERYGGNPAHNTRVLGIEVEDHVDVSISIDILKGKVHRSSLSTGCPKADRARVYGGAIKGISSQNGHGDLPFAPRVDTVRQADLDRNDRRRFVNLQER